MIHEHQIKQKQVRILFKLIILYQIYLASTAGKTNNQSTKSVSRQLSSSEKNIKTKTDSTNRSTSDKVNQYINL